MKNIGFYHHGAAPADDVKAALEKLPLRLSRRNALHFLPSDAEDFDTVVVDDGRNAKLIGDTYAGKKVPVVTIADFLAEFAKPASKANKGEPADDQQTADAPQAGFDPDAKRKGGRPPKQQG